MIIALKEKFNSKLSHNPQTLWFLWCDLAMLVWLFRCIFQEFLSHYAVNVQRSTLWCLLAHLQKFLKVH